MRRFLTLALLLAILLPGCASAGTAPPAAPAGEMVTLEYYTIGNPDRDLQEVNAELNRLLADKIGIQVRYHKIPWSDYNDYVTNLISSGGSFDIAFAASMGYGDFVGNARRGVWLPLDDYLDTSCRDMYEAIDPLFWEGVNIDGHIYGVPTNKELAVPIHWVYAQELVEKYNIDISRYLTLESLEPLFSMIKENEPEYTVMGLSSDSNNFFALDNYEFLLDSKVPLMLRSDDENLELVNIFATDYGKETLQTLRRFYLAGFINADAALQNDQSLAKGEKVFWFASSGGPYSETTWSKERGYPLVGQQVTQSYVNLESVRGGIMAVSGRTRYPEECAAFLNCLNTDPEVRNLVNYGIEGTHYELTEEDQVKILDSDYAGVQYTQGNWFILKTVVGDPPDKWDVYKKFNREAVRSKSFGFIPSVNDPTVSKQIKAVSTVTNKYYSALMTGTVDPEVILPRFLDELENAGISKLQETFQRQLDKWNNG